MAIKNSPSPYFNFYDHERRQKMFEDIIINTIRMSGVNLKYIPREIFERDRIYGEDPYTRFEYAVNLEAYPKNVDTFDGAGNIFSKFDFEIKNQITFTIARKRWNQIRTEKFLTEDGFVLQTEDGNNLIPESSSGVLLEEGSAEGYSIQSEKPVPGDLIYFPMVNKLFEIADVKHEVMFYQHGKLMTYDLICEVFDYSHEVFETGVDEIDEIETMYQGDELNSLFLLEDGGLLLLEDGDRLIIEQEIKDTVAINRLLQTEVDPFVDWKEKTPFTNTGTGKW